MLSPMSFIFKFSPQRMISLWISRKGQGTIHHMHTPNILSLPFCPLHYISFRFRWYSLASPTSLLPLLKPKRHIYLLPLPHLPELTDHKVLLIFLMNNFQIIPSFPFGPTIPAFPIPQLDDGNALLIGLFCPKAPPPYYCWDELSELKICWKVFNGT